MTEVITYHSVNAKPNQAWLGYVVLSDGSTLWVRFEGATEQDVINRARAWYICERARQARITGAVDAQKVLSDGEDDLATQVAPSLQNRTSDNPSGKGTHFAGKVWMINRETGNRARVSQDEVKLMEASGYVRGGPRSK